ncbi:MAG: dihydroneopterin aldolase [Bacteroidia bacterium]
MKGKIILHDLEFHAFHGVYPQEKADGQTFIVNLELVFDSEKAALSDNIEDTLDYVNVCLAIKEEMEISSNLLENVAQRIINRLKLTYNQIEEISITLTKRNPPIDIKTGGISVVIKG